MFASLSWNSDSPSNFPDQIKKYVFSNSVYHYVYTKEFAGLLDMNILIIDP